MNISQYLIFHFARVFFYFFLLHFSVMKSVVSTTFCITALVWSTVFWQSFRIWMPIYSNSKTSFWAKFKIEFVDVDVFLLLQKNQQMTYDFTFTSLVEWVKYRNRSAKIILKFTFQFWLNDCRWQTDSTFKIEMDD